MHFDSRTLIFWAANLLLFFLTMLVNSRLAPLSLYLILLGPMLVLPAVYLKAPSLVLCCFITGLFIDALLPQNFWLFIYGLPIIGLVIQSLRSIFRTETSYRFVLLAQVANFACIVLLTITQSIRTGHLLASLPQISVIFILSHLILLAVTPWFLNFERFLFRFLNMEHAYQDEFLKP